MRLLNRYIFVSILGTTMIVALAITAISTVLELVDVLADISADGKGLAIALQIVMLQLPGSIYELFPVIVLLGTVLGLGGLANGSELIAMRASGVSLARLSGSALRVGLLLALICIFISEWLAPRAEALEQQIRAAYNLKEDEWPPTGEGLWLRDGDSFIRVGAVVTPRLLEEIHLYRFGPERQLQIAVEADNARYLEGRWKLMEVRYTEFRDRQVKSYTASSMDWNTSLKPELLQVSVKSPEHQTMHTLYQYVRYLESYQLDASHYRIALWSKAAVPAMILIMAVVAVPFVVGPLRTTGAGQRMFVGMVVGVIFFLLNELTLSTGRVYGLSPLMSAWLPSMILAGATLIWLAYLNWPAPVQRMLRPFRSG